MSSRIQALIDKHLGTSKYAVIDEQSFAFGAFALKLEIEDFVSQMTQGERHGEFQMGQDDGLRWVLDHLEFIFEPSL